MPMHVAVKVMPVLLERAWSRSPARNRRTRRSCRPSDRRSASDGKTDRITGGGKLDDGRTSPPSGSTPATARASSNGCSNCLDG